MPMSVCTQKTIDNKTDAMDHVSTFYTFDDVTTPGVAEIAKMQMNNNLKNVKTLYSVNNVIVMKNNYQFPMKLELILVQYKISTDKSALAVLAQGFDDIQNLNGTYEVDIGSRISDVKTTPFARVLSTKSVGRATLQPGQEYTYRNIGKRRLWIGISRMQIIILATRFVVTPL